MSRHRWFLPDTPDVVGQLREQLAITAEGLAALTRWADGEEGAADAVRDAERRGDVARRGVFAALRAAFVTPLEPEDVFTLSRGIDRILDYAQDLTVESEVMECPPDQVLAEMARLLGNATASIDTALAHVGNDETTAIQAAEAAIEAERELERVYYRGMAGLLSASDRHERIARRELYRRSSRIGEAVIDVAERVVYAVVKQS
jgi:uncharacterized protein Yka (UPF0111/DUF47 family)